MSLCPHPRAARRGRTLLPLLALLAAAACSTDRPTAPSMRLLPGGIGFSVTNDLGTVQICKHGPVGTYTFDWSAATDPVQSGVATITTQDGNNPYCVEIWDVRAKGSVPITITEAYSPGTMLVDIELRDGMTGAVVQSFPIATRSMTFTPRLDMLSLVKFENQPSDGGDVCADQGAMNPGQPLPCLYGRLGDFVWVDGNGNGLQDAGELGIPGVTVTLSGPASATTTTDAGGYYHFEHLGPGTYTVAVATPANFAPTTPLAGTNRAIDSNGSPTSSTLSLSTLEDLTLDFGFLAVCTDPMASNYGQPGPCTYPPPSTPCPDGSFTWAMAANGDLNIKFDQFPAPNDNSYGVNSIGWPVKRGHRFSDLVNSDHAGFELMGADGRVKLSFNVDYLTASASAPSGYASLGVSGGDGKMITGTADGIIATTSLARNLNNINIPGLFNAAHVQQFGSVNVLQDSPPTDAAHLTYVISDPALAGWDFRNTYFVTITAAKLAAIGFNPATWQVQPNADQLHNSPAKACPTN